MAQEDKYTPFGVVLNELMRARGMDQKEFAERMRDVGYNPKFSQAHVSYLLREAIGPPDLEFGPRLIEALGLSENEQNRLGYAMLFGVDPGPNR
jgi:transcriptional regulator with XRE-family HTH domain